MRLKKDLNRPSVLKSAIVLFKLFHGSITRTQKKCFLVLQTVRRTNL